MPDVSLVKTPEDEAKVQGRQGEPEDKSVRLNRYSLC